MRYLGAVTALAILVVLLVTAFGRVAPTVAPGTLVVTSQPDSAAIQIDGDDTGEVTPHTFGDLEPTQYVVAVTKPDHVADPDSQVVNLGAGQTTNVSFSLQRDIGGLQVTSTPTGATIFFDDNDTGEVTDHLFAALAPGDYTVRVALSGYAVNPTSLPVTVTRGDTATAGFILSQEVGGLTVTSTPAGAEILLDGIGQAHITPYTFDALVPGDYEVSVQLAGYVVQPGDPDPQAVTVVVDQTATADFTLVQTGAIEVTSTPATGAAILLDGVDTGQVTDATVTDLAPGTYTVAVNLPGHVAVPADQQLLVISGQTSQAAFQLVPLTAQKVVLVEGFSNVNCVGCPEMSAMMQNQMGLDGYGLDKLLYIKYSENFPAPYDPHYLANAADNRARNNYYDGQWAIPTLFGEGALLGQHGIPPSPPDLQAFVDAALAESVSFAIAVSADLSSDTVPVEVTLTATEDIDLTGYTLTVVMVEEEIHYDAPPGNQGETEFHWVMLDVATAEADIGNLTVGTPAQYQTIVFKPATSEFVVDDPVVIAFVQHNTNLEILQAGSTATVNLPEAGSRAVRPATVETTVPRTEGNRR